MSKLDKDQVIADFTAAYEKAHGKKPTIEASNGWYSVDGGKNMRLAQLAEETEALGGTKAAAKPATKSAAKATAKPAAKKSSSKKAAAKKSTSGGLTARELWRKKLEDDATLSRLPRGC